MESQKLSNPKIFFSYSRADGEKYALQLANDLRNAGADVWIDQLDIEPGKIWDFEVEKALNAANCVLFLATEKSIGSNNVLNEVYYAIEENKTVIPVLFHDCKIPFRLMRLQRVDFTGDYQVAFQRLLKALGSKESNVLPQQVSGTAGTKPVSTDRPTNETASSKPEQEKETSFVNKKETEEPTLVTPEPERGKSKKPLLWGAGFVAVAAVLFILLKGTTSSIEGVQADVRDSLKHLASDSLLVSGLTDSSGTGAAKSHSSTGSATLPDITGKKEENKNPSAQTEGPQSEGTLPDKPGSGSNPKDSIKILDKGNLSKYPQFNKKPISQLNIKAVSISAAEVLQNIKVRVKPDAGDTRNDKLAYHYSLDAPAKYLNVINEVRYQRNHPNFPAEHSGAKYSLSADRSSQFSFKGYQGIRLQSVFVTVVMKDGSISERMLKPLVYSE